MLELWRLANTLFKVCEERSVVRVWCERVNLVDRCADAPEASPGVFFHFSIFPSVGECGYFDVFGFGTRSFPRESKGGMLRRQNSV